MSGSRRRSRFILSSCENVPPSPLGGVLPPAGGAVSEKIAAMRDHWTEKTEAAAAARRSSPILMQLQRESEAASTRREAGGSVRARRKELERLHHEAKSRREGVGGGVSLWPAMDDMRLSRRDTVQLTLLCLLLSGCTAALFTALHGANLEKLKWYSSVLVQFCSSHSLHSDRGQGIFDEDVYHWHSELLSLQSAVHRDFDIVWSETSSFYVFSTLLYIAGVIVLLYFLAENVLSKNRLTPRRIKIWVSLMCIMAVWTLLSLKLLFSAQKLEADMEATIFSLTDKLAGLVGTELDLTQYRDVLLYWQTLYLHPHSRGLLSFLGLLPVRDLSFYLHYYSLPILTAICTPIIKLIISLRAVYRG